MNEQHKKAIEIAEALSKVKGTEKWKYVLATAFRGLDCYSIKEIGSWIGENGVVIHGPWLPVDDFGAQCCVKWLRGSGSFDLAIPTNTDMMLAILRTSRHGWGREWKAGQKAIGVE